MTPTTGRAFSLIELLVVITIIAVLLALLAPALEKAVYQAELATCGANLRGIGSGAVMYTADNRRAYPRTRVPPGTSNTYGVMYLRESGSAGDPAYDLPGQIGSYIAVHMFADPLSGKVKFDAGSTDPNWLLWANYPFFFGWHYNGFKGMKKLGSSFESLADPRGPAASRPVKQFHVLAGDQDWLRAPSLGIGDARASHPDAGGVMSFYQNQGYGSDQDPGITWSFWFTDSNRGLLETQFTYEDGSVRRFQDVRIFDERMAYVPRWGNDPPRAGAHYDGGRVVQLPAGR